MSWTECCICTSNLGRMPQSSLFVVVWDGRGAKKRVLVEESNKLRFHPFMIKELVSLLYLLKLITYDSMWYKDIMIELLLIWLVRKDFSLSHTTGKGKGSIYIENKINSISFCPCTTYYTTLTAQCEKILFTKEVNIKEH